MTTEQGEKQEPQEEMVPKRDLDGLRASLMQGFAEEKAGLTRRLTTLEDELTLLREQAPKPDTQEAERMAQRRQEVQRKRLEEDLTQRALALKRRELGLEFSLKPEELEGEDERALENSALRKAMARFLTQSPGNGTQGQEGKAPPAKELDRAPAAGTREDLSKLSPMEKMRLGSKKSAEDLLKNLR